MTLISSGSLVLILALPVVIGTLVVIALLQRRIRRQGELILDLQREIATREPGSVPQELAGLRLALDQHASVSITDAQGTIVHVNENFCTISKYPREELIGQNHRILKSGYHGTEFFEEMYRCLAVGKLWHGEIQNRAKDGSLYWVETTIVPVMNAGKPDRYIAFRNNITERKRAELMRERLTAAVVEFSDDAIISKTLESTITTWNRGAERLFGYPREEAIGQSILMLLPEERKQEETAILARIIRGEHVENFETVRLRKDGSRIDVSVTISPIFDLSGAIIGASNFARDITQKKAAERVITQLNQDLRHRNETLERSNIELQQFAYIASHDLQSPLRSIRGFLELLQIEYADKLDAQGRDWIRRSTQATTQMHALIRDVLAYSKVDGRALPFAPVSLGDVVDDVIGLLNSSIREAGAKITWGELPFVVGDRSQLVQLMQNLIGNALTYRSDQAPEIRITAELRGDGWQIAVRDNGIGIEPRYHERIFEIFKRLQLQKQYPGTGMGLAVCRRVVERHGGTIWVESELGCGSTFFFTVPERMIEQNEQPVGECETSADTSRRG